MKTMKIFSALSLAMILFVLISNNVNAGNNKPTALIKYQVIIHGDADSFFPYPMIVFITDGNGRVVAHPQVYVQGTFIYGFTEPGPQTGTRIAKMTIDPQVNGVNLEVIPDVKNGTFEVNKIYTFNLHLRSPKPRVESGFIE